MVGFVPGNVNNFSNIETPQIEFALDPCKIRQTFSFHLH